MLLEETKNVFNRGYVLFILDFVVNSLMYVSMSVCVYVCLFPRREVISELISKCDTWFGASWSHRGSYIHHLINYTGCLEKNAPKVNIILSFCKFIYGYEI